MVGERAVGVEGFGRARPASNGPQTSTSEAHAPLSTKGLCVPSSSRQQSLDRMGHHIHVLAVLVEATARFRSCLGVAGAECHTSCHVEGRPPRRRSPDASHGTLATSRYQSCYPTEFAPQHPAPSRSSLSATDPVDGAASVLVLAVWLPFCRSCFLHPIKLMPPRMTPISKLDRATFSLRALRASTEFVSPIITSIVSSTVSCVKTSSLAA